jgi:hypothetical protein
MDDLCPKELHNEGVTYVLRNCTMDDLCPKELHNGELLAKELHNG